MLRIIVYRCPDKCPPWKSIKQWLWINIVKSIVTRSILKNANFEYIICSNKQYINGKYK